MIKTKPPLCCYHFGGTGREKILTSLSKTVLRVFEADMRDVYSSMSMVMNCLARAGLLYPSLSLLSNLSFTSFTKSSTSISSLRNSWCGSWEHSLWTSSAIRGRHNLVLLSSSVEGTMGRMESKQVFSRHTICHTAWMWPVLFTCHKTLTMWKIYFDTSAWYFCSNKLPLASS